MIKIYLYHYFDRAIELFINLSDIPVEEAKAVLNTIKETKPNTQCAKRHPEYIEDRYYYKEILRTEFAKKGGIISRNSPHYMVVEHSPWLSTWFENSDFIKIPIGEFNLKTISFTYGDSHPTFSPRANKMDGKVYRKKLYTYDKILTIIEKYGLLQDWNDDGKYGPERYIEAHIWGDETIDRYNL